MTTEHLIELLREERRAHYRKLIPIAQATTNPDSTVLRSKLTSILRPDANNIRSAQQALAAVEQLSYTELTNHYWHCSLCRTVLGTEEELLALITQALDRPHLEDLCHDKFRCPTHYRPWPTDDDEDEDEDEDEEVEETEKEEEEL